MVIKGSLTINVTHPKEAIQIQMFLPHTQGPKVCTTTVAKLAKVYSHCNHSPHATKTSRNIVIFPTKLLLPHTQGDNVIMYVVDTPPMDQAMPTCACHAPKESRQVNLFLSHR